MSTNHCTIKSFWWVRACAPHLWFLHPPNWHFSIHKTPLQRPGMCAVDNLQHLIFGSLLTSSQEIVKQKSAFKFTFRLRTIYKVNGIDLYIERRWPTTDKNAILVALLHHNEGNFLKLTAKNRSKIYLKKSVPNNGRLALLRNYRQQLPSLAHQKTIRLSPYMPNSPWRCSDLNMTRCRIRRRRKTWSWGMKSFPTRCNRKRRTKRRNRWRNNSGPRH